MTIIIIICANLPLWPVPLKKGGCGGRELSTLQQIKNCPPTSRVAASLIHLDLVGPITPYIDCLVYFNVRPSPYYQYNEELTHTSPRAERIFFFHQLLIFHLRTIWTSAGGHKNVQFTTKVTIKSWDSPGCGMLEVLID